MLHTYFHLDSRRQESTCEAKVRHGKLMAEQVCKEIGLGQGSMLDACGHDDELTSIKKNGAFRH